MAFERYNDAPWTDAERHAARAVLREFMQRYQTEAQRMVVPADREEFLRALATFWKDANDFVRMFCPEWELSKLADRMEEERKASMEMLLGKKDEVAPDEQA